MTNKELVIQRFKDTIEVKEDIMADNTVADEKYFYHVLISP